MVNLQDRLVLLYFLGLKPGSLIENEGHLLLVVLSARFGILCPQANLVAYKLLSLLLLQVGDALLVLQDFMQVFLRLKLGLLPLALS